MLKRPNHHHRAMRRYFRGMLGSEIRTPGEIELIVEGFLAYDEDHDRFILPVPTTLEPETVDRMVELFWKSRRKYTHRPDMSLPGKVKFETKKHNYLEIRSSITESTLFIASRYHD
jgi:hypothetical protein